jgi:hypothetical protein
MTARTKAIIAVHLFGIPADMSSLMDFGVPVVEDCAHGIGITRDSPPLGKRGRTGSRRRVPDDTLGGDSCIPVHECSSDEISNRGKGLSGGPLPDRRFVVFCARARTSQL